MYYDVMMVPEPMKQLPPLEELDAATPDDEPPEEDVEGREALRLIMV